MSARGAMRLRSALGLAPRALRERPARAALTAAAVALGVALVLATLALSSTIDDSLRRVYATAYGNTDLIVSSANGSARLPAALADRAEAVDGVASVTGLVTSPVTLFDRRGRLLDAASEGLQLTGLRPGDVDPAGTTYAEGRPVRQGAELALQRDVARAHALRIGEQVRLAVPTGTLRVRLVGTYAFAAGAGVPGQGFGLVPLATARRAFDAPRGFDLLTLKARDRDLPALQRRLQRALGAGVAVQTSGEQAGDVLDRLSALKVLLAVFGAMSLFTAAVLINGILALTMAERRRQIGVLRALGARRRVVRRVVLAEVGLLAAAGTLAGLGLGLVAARGLLAVARALGVPTAGLQVPWWAVVVAAAAGVVLPLLSALAPAAHAAAVPPVQALARAAGGSPSRVPAPGALAAGALLVLAGALLVVTHPGGDGSFAVVLSGGGAAVALLLGAALLTPAAGRVLLGAVAALLARRGPVSARVAADAVRANLPRSTAAAGTLMVGLGLVTALGTLGESFLRSTSATLDAGLHQDLTVQPPRLNPLSAAPVQSISPKLTARIARTPGVATASGQRLLVVDDVAGRETGILLGVDPGALGAVDGRRYAGASRREVVAALRRGEVALGDGVARRTGLGPGDVLVLRGPEGTVRARVTATFDDPALLGRTVLLSARTLARTYGVRRDSAVLVAVRAGADRDAVATRLRRLVAAEAPQLQVLSTGELRAKLDGQVAQQFGVFNVLLGVTIVISLLGLVATLSMSVLERRREIATLRALGLTARQLRRSVVFEALAIAAAGATIGLAAGLALGLLYVRRLQDLLPSIDVVVPAATITAVVLLACVLAVLGAALPARRAARMRLLDGLAYD
jgi:putative ABC transport system permease protein